MHIHVVTPGESLWSISQLYNIPYPVISEANQLPNPNQLVVGQALVIPIEEFVHFIQPGESLWLISQRYQVPLSDLLELNDLPAPESIPIGFPIIIFRGKQKVPIDVGAYIDLQITGENSAETLREIAEHLTYVQVFRYDMNPDGTLTGYGNDQPVINTAYQNEVIPLMVITNIDEEGFSTDLVTTVLASDELQNRLLDEALALMDEKGYLGLDFDLEYVGAQNRERYNDFMRKAKERLDERNYLLSSALAPKVSPDMEGVLYEGHDYAAHGETADFVFLMTYEWGWIGGPPMAVAPINEVRRVIDYAVTVIPNDKIMMGIPLYGYDWTLPYVEGETRATSIDPQQAIALALRYNAAIEYDEEAQSPFFTYYDEEGREHEVWFEDARSIQAKFDLVKEYELRGFFYWVLGRDFPQNWLLIEDNFNVNKRV